MPAMNAFTSDVFNTVSMTTAINKLPVVPGLIGSIPGLIRTIPVSTTSIMLDEQQGRISLIQTSQRGSGNNRMNDRATRKAHSFACQHIETFDTVLAESSQNVRKFGSDSELESVTDIVNERMMTMKQNIELTLEWHRAGMIKGNVYDADGSTVIYNWFTQFGLSETTVDFAFTTTTTNIKKLANDVIRAISDALGNAPFKGVVALCSDGFFDSLIAHPVVVAAYDKQNGGGDFLQKQQAGDGQTYANSFTYGDINWINYRGVVGSNYMIPANTCRFFPVGVPDLFQCYFAPADYMETVNTLGKPYYAKKKILDYDKGVELEAQSNPLFIPTRPKCLIKGTKS